jgi:hypothetical protein
MSKRRIVSFTIAAQLVVLALLGAIFWSDAQSAGPVWAQSTQPGPGQPERDPQPGSYQVATEANQVYLTLAGYTFVARPPLPAATPTHLNYVSGGGVYASNPPNNDPLVTNVNLPNGAIVTELRLYYFDQSESRDVDAELRRTDFLGNVDSMAAVSSTGTPGFQSAATAAITLNPINNASYAYTVNVYLNPGTNPDRLRLYGIRIGYTFGNASYLPAVP